MLSLSQIKSITFGALEVTEEYGEFCFRRFENTARDFYSSVGFSTASVLLDFLTDAEALSFDYRCIKRVDRCHCFFDIYENDVLIGHTGRVCEKEEAEFSGKYEVKLSSGSKRIRIYFPNLFEGRIKNLVLSGNTYIKRAEKSKKLLMMGDSITHGYDACFPSLSYANTVARELDFDMINQAVGGEMFKGASLPEKTSLSPDYITVAYGTNDWSWSHKTLDECIANERIYFEKLKALYPCSKIIYISPLYRGDNTRLTELGGFKESVRCFAETAAGYGASVIDGWELIPHTSEVFEDKYLHPNDLGFTQYAKALLRELYRLGIK